jgi:hypothetical protein
MTRILAVSTGLIFTLLCSCSTRNEDQYYERQDKLVLAKEEFDQKKKSCRAMSGSMHIRLKTLGEYDYHDYRLARCVKIR